MASGFREVRLAEHEVVSLKSELSAALSLRLGVKVNMHLLLQGRSKGSPQVAASRKDFTRNFVNTTMLTKEMPLTLSRWPLKRNRGRPSQSNGHHVGVRT